MHKLILIVGVAAVLAGCAGGGGRAYSDPYRTETGSVANWSAPRYDDRYWPPVDPNSAFPAQIMDGGSQD
ncbi:MAG: hypothetical protein ACT4PS_01445 [Betaproteobacteria bacterium]